MAIVAAAIDFSFVGMIKNADPVVQGIALMLVLASIATWAIILEKMVRLTGVGRQARQFADAVRDGRLPSPDSADFGGVVARAARHELSEGSSAGETRTEVRARLERAMRGAVKGELRRYESGMSLLATVGSIAPFVGLLGTVWGIMHAFTSIASAKDTSLAVVAPGIAEALFVTALGLFAAIPAVVAYNQVATALGRVNDEAGKAVAVAATWLSRGDAEKIRPLKGIK